ncbi:uncharacterized protein LOC110923644 [Helianthus annuus]|uniref:uncharacterized protein LOC110923644 n=1 Tax=Helianthus annuus TaxID=4232 RepID=UPI000B9095DE|nr:uncharacterized protein LOC110923644 [Helianthus annuus]KAJ0446212.1 hypothetical protein HanHA89_Chr17g0691901 [Helianthus annuus]
MNGDRERRKMSAPLSNRFKDKDEDLLLFQEMHKRDKNRVVSLLLPVSDEFEPNGNYPLYGMASTKKGPGLGFLGESEKNDYDWLKTPPATPLFPSIEMEARNAQELVVQRELPITQPLSRFAGKPEEKETKQINIGSNSGKPKTPNPRPRIPARSVTPSGRSSGLFIDQKKNIKTAPIPLITSVHKSSVTDLTNTTSVSKPLSERDNRLILNQSRTTQKTRGVSPVVTSRITQIPGFSDETPPNLRTDRSISATRGRVVNQTTRNALTVASQKPEVSNMRAARRQSCSPSVTRGRKVAPTSEESMATVNALKGSNRMFQTGNGAQILGSRMVDKLMNARKSGTEEKKLNGSINGYGRLMSQGSLDMESKRDSVHFRQAGTSLGRKSVSTTYAPSSRSSGGSYRF